MDTEQPLLIAVVDDEESIRRALTRLLRSAGLVAEAYASGTKFIESLLVRRPDCIVLDIHMLGMNGFEVQTILVETHMSIPVVVITGHDSAQTRDQALAFHPAAYLLKPINDQTLLDAIWSAVGTTRSQIAPEFPPAP